MFEDIERVCARCGVTFYLRCGARGWTYKLLIDGRQRYYCSHACMREAQRQLETVRRERPYKFGKREKSHEGSGGRSV